MTVGIVCEYNPFHLGHAKQFAAIREQFGPDTAIVCAMSGNFVQRGHPAIMDKSIRAEIAVKSGADLVVELPITTSLSSAEGFAAGGVKILSRLCDVLCFGTESGNADSLISTAEALLSGEFPPLLRQFLEDGLSFPAARQKALEAMGEDASLLASPNDILGVEYCKAILSQKSKLDIFPIHREGNYHAEDPDPENPSATALRKMLISGGATAKYTTEIASVLAQNASLHASFAAEKALLYRLRTMSEADFEVLPYGSEGLWRKLMHASRRENTLEEILNSVKSKRYTRTRLDRMVMCAFLGINAEDMAKEIPYARVLAFNDKGREILSCVKKEGFFRNCGEETRESYEILEHRAGALYGLFAINSPEPPLSEQNRRVKYVK